MHSGIPNPAGVKSRQQPGENIRKNHPESYSPSQKCLGEVSNKKKRPWNLETFSDTERKGWQRLWKAGHEQRSSGLSGKMAPAVESRCWTVEIPALPTVFLPQGTPDGPAGKTSPSTA